MTSTELYINGVLVDIARDLGVRLNRQLLNPGELNTKDAQYSYSISLPPTATNNKAFNYAHVEETKNKFNREYNAELYINGIRIFSGKFRLSNIERDGYKGNLYMPVRKSIRDIFGELRLNQNPEYRLPFNDFATSINDYNTDAANGPQMAIFPYALYGVLPKTPLNKDANSYSARTLWDDSVRLGMQDLAPSINPLLMLRHIFQAQGYTLQGDAFDDEKLARLYMSYKNADTYVQPWNYGQHARIEITGEWSNKNNMRTGILNKLERGVNQGNDLTGATYSVDFFDSSNSKIEIAPNGDPGGNVSIGVVQDNSGLEWTKAQIRIPVSGFYKVSFNASIQVYDLLNSLATDTITGVNVIGDHSDGADNNFLNRLYEIRLCRDRGQAEFGLSDPKHNSQFYADNQPQNQIFDKENSPKYFPQILPDGQINFVDRLQDRYHLLGFALGRNAEPDGVSKEREQYINPLDDNESLKSILVSKPAVSWKTSENTEKPTRLAVNSPGYMKYGLIGDFPDPSLDPALDYSAGPFVTGQVLNSQGNPVAPGGGNLTNRITNYFVNKAGGYLQFLTGWETSDYIDLNQWNSLEFSTTVSDNPDASILSFYDINFQFIGSGIDGPAIGSTDTYTNQAITPPALAVYARICGETPVAVTGTDVLTGNKILHRFEIDRYYTYVLTTDPADGYEGFAYIHRDATTQAPLQVVPFINGVAEFSTVYNGGIRNLDLRLTIYLITPNYNVDGTLIISRTIDENSSNVLDWEETKKYKIELDNAPANYITRGQYDGATGLDQYNNAQGEVNAVVWLEAGELVTIGSISTEGRYLRNDDRSKYGWVAHEVKFNLSIQPFRIDENWLKVSLSGNGTGVMDWNDPVNFDVNSINLVGFLSADIKTDDFIENFCKAFNLRLSQINATTFSLDVKQSKTAVSNRYIELDGVASVADRANTPLGLPSLYKIGFTVDVDEEGYVESGDDGGGSFKTGATEEEIVEQKSTFSFNWFKDITKVETGGNVNIPLPIISKKDVWAPSMSYTEAMSKKYTDQAYRFWYYDGLLNDLGVTFQFNGNPLQIAKVSNEIFGLSILNYKNLQYSILDNYFTLLINGASHYTEVEGYLTPLQYHALNGSILAMFNGDLYYVAELNGYDPAARNKTKIKLIRKI